MFPGGLDPRIDRAKDFTPDLVLRLQRSRRFFFLVLKSRPLFPLDDFDGFMCWGHMTQQNIRDGSAKLTLSELTVLAKNARP